MAVTNEKHHTAGQTFMQAVLAKLPEEKRAKAAELFTGEDVDPVIETLGEGAMLRSDYSKKQNELGTAEGEIQAHWTRLNTWYASKKGELDQAEATKARLEELEASAGHGDGAGDGSGDGPPAGASKNGQTAAPPMTKEQMLKTLGLDPGTLVTRNDLANAINTTERGMLAFFNEADPLSVEHFKTFGEVLNTAEIFAHPKIQEIGFKAAYLEVHKEKFETLAQKEQEAHDKTVAEKAIADYQKEHAGQQGFPLPSRMPSGHVSPLDTLEASMRTPAKPAGDGQQQPNATAPGPGHTNLADDNALVDTAVAQFLERAQELGRPVARL
jgi:hypothetical protein